MMDLELQQKMAAGLAMVAGHTLPLLSQDRSNFGNSAELFAVQKNWNPFNDKTILKFHQEDDFKDIQKGLNTNPGWLDGKAISAEDYTLDQSEKTITLSPNFVQRLTERGAFNLKRQKKEKEVLNQCGSAISHNTYYLHQWEKTFSAEEISEWVEKAQLPEGVSDANLCDSIKNRKKPQTEEEVTTTGETLSQNDIQLPNTVSQSVQATMKPTRTV